MYSGPITARIPSQIAPSSGDRGLRNLHASRVTWVLAQRGAGACPLGDFALGTGLRPRAAASRGVGAEALGATRGGRARGLADGLGVMTMESP